MNRMGTRGFSLTMLLLMLLCATGCSAWQSEVWRRRPGEAGDPAGRGPYAVDTIEVELENPETGNVLPTVIWFPSSDGGVDPSGTPYPGVVFCHGFLANPLLYPGNGQHLASWGYVVAMPAFPDEALAMRVSDARHVLAYLRSPGDVAGTMLAGTVDAQRISLVGHSLGGLTALAGAEEDGQVTAVVALDPVNPPRFAGVNAWDADVKGPEVVAPTLIVGAEAQACNYFGSYNDIFPRLGAPHKALLVLTDGNHCDFMQTHHVAPREACYQLCGGEYDEARVALAARYGLAWLNYYLGADAGSFDALYGAAAKEDQERGRVDMTVDTAPTGVRAEVVSSGIRVVWNSCEHAPIAGYGVYRRSAGEEYGSAPHRTLGVVSTFQDEGLVGGRVYSYTIRSRDAWGNEHQASREVSARAPTD